MKMLVNYLAVAGAGAAGAMLRYFVATVCGHWFGRDFPIGTLLINLSGSLFLGWFLTRAGGAVPMREPLKLAIGVGFVGAYTTFSTYMYESNDLLHEGAMLKAGVNLIGSMVLGLICVRVGIWLAAR